MIYPTRYFLVQFVHAQIIYKEAESNEYNFCTHGLVWSFLIQRCLLAIFKAHCYLSSIYCIRLFLTRLTCFKVGQTERWGDCIVERKIKHRCRPCDKISVKEHRELHFVDFTTWSPDNMQRNCIHQKEDVAHLVGFHI